MTHRIELTETARELLENISDRRIQAKMIERIAALAEDPEKQGKPLADDLDGYRSVRAVGQRYRIIYRVDGDRVLVLIVMVGIRKEGDKRDVYRLAKRLVRLGLLEGEKTEEDAPSEEVVTEESSETSSAE